MWAAKRPNPTWEVNQLPKYTRESQDLPAHTKIEEKLCVLELFSNEAQQLIAHEPQREQGNSSSDGKSWIVKMEAEQIRAVFTLLL